MGSSLRNHILASLVERFSYRGRYVDYWTLVHIATGVGFGCGLAIGGFSFWAGFVITFIALVLWEVVEPPLHGMFGRKFPEALSNQVTDVVVGMVGYVAGVFCVAPHEIYILLMNTLDQLV